MEKNGHALGRKYSHMQDPWNGCGSDPFLSQWKQADAPKNLAYLS